jgi:urea transport system permease protein
MTATASSPSPTPSRLLGLFQGPAAVPTAIFLAALIGVPLLNVMPPDGSPLHVPDYAIGVLGKFLCFALLAMAHGLLWGYAGPLSLGHGAFFGLGGYCMGMYLMRQIGDRGVYGDPVLPDFMVFLDWEHLPWYWHGFDNFAFAMLMVLVVPGLLAFVFGYLTFRSRITGVYFSIISQAMVFALMLAFYRNEMGFGGNNGLTDFKDILGFPIQAQSTRIGLYMATVLVLAGCYWMCRAIVTSKMGRVLVAVREAEPRVRFLGYPANRIKLFVFVVSAMMSGVAGALYVPQVGIINPNEFEPSKSIEIAVWVAVGGRGTLFGPILGAVGVNGAKSFFTGFAPEAWLFVLGGLFIVVTLFLPQGIAGLGPQIRRRIARARGRDHG